jgi:hypothetical protein
VNKKILQVEKMNNQAFSLAERLIPSTYVQQGLNAKKSRENLIRHFIEHVSYNGAKLYAHIQIICHEYVLFHNITAKMAGRRMGRRNDRGISVGPVTNGQQ